MSVSEPVGEGESDACLVNPPLHYNVHCSHSKYSRPLSFLYHIIVRDYEFVISNICSGEPHQRIKQRPTRLYQDALQHTSFSERAPLSLASRKEPKLLKDYHADLLPSLAESGQQTPSDRVDATLRSSVSVGAYVAGPPEAHHCLCSFADGKSGVQSRYSMTFGVP